MNLSILRGPIGLLIMFMLLTVTGCSGEQQRISAELSRLSEQVTILVLLMGGCWVVMSILAMSLGFSLRKLVKGGSNV